MRSGLGGFNDSELSFSQKAMIYACLGAVVQRAQRLAIIYTHSSGRTIVTKEDLAKCLKSTIMDIGEQVEQVATSTIENKPLPEGFKMDDDDAECVANLYQKCITELTQGRESSIKYGSFIQDTTMAEDGIVATDGSGHEDEDIQQAMSNILQDCGVDFSPQDIVDEIDTCEEDWKEWTPETLTQQRMWEAVQRLESTKQ